MSYTEEDEEDVALDVSPAADEQVFVSIDDLLADGYEIQYDDDEYIA